VTTIIHQRYFIDRERERERERNYRWKAIFVFRRTLNDITKIYESHNNKMNSTSLNSLMLTM